MITSISNLNPGDDNIQTIFGTVVSVSEDEFVLQDETGEVLVDAYDYLESEGDLDLGLGVGQEVTVVGDLDDEDFDAYDITLGGDASQPSSVTGNYDSLQTVTLISDLNPADDNVQTIFGTVVSVSEDEFVLQDETGEVLVDAYDYLESEGDLDLGLGVGQEVTVVGDLDDEDFDAYGIAFEGDASQPSSATGNYDSLQTITSISDLIPEDDNVQIISGTVVSVSEDEFVLQDETGEVLVDAYDYLESEGDLDLGLGVGQEVTVVGDLDDEDFDAYGIAFTETDNSNLTLINFPSDVILTEENGIITLSHQIESIDIYGSSSGENFEEEGLNNFDLITGFQDRVDLTVNNSVDSGL